MTARQAGVALALALVVSVLLTYLIFYGGKGARVQVLRWLWRRFYSPVTDQAAKDTGLDPALARASRAPWGPVPEPSTPLPAIFRKETDRTLYKPGELERSEIARREWLKRRELERTERREWLEWLKVRGGQS